MRRQGGFTLVEMLVVVGIIAILVSASLAGFSRMKESAEKTRAQEIVSNAATALTSLYDADGMWPKKLREVGETGGILDEPHARILASRGYMSLTMANGKLAGNDRFGILTPWGAKVVSRLGASAAGKLVSGSSVLEDHILHFAIDVDGDGKIEGVDVGGESVNIRATAAVWCVGKSGGKDHKPWPYKQGLKKDDVYSWTRGQTIQVK